MREEICRLCFKKLNETNFEEMDPEMSELIKEMMDIVLLKQINLNISQEHAICTECVENLRKSFDFKSECFYTEDFISPFVDSVDATSVNLYEILMKEGSAKTVHIQDKQNICRLCLKLLADNYFKPLYGSDENIITIQDLIQKYIPELNLTVTQMPVICAACLESLTKYSDFVINCITTENKINSYCETERTARNGKLKLIDVLRFDLKGTLKCESVYDFRSDNSANVMVEKLHLEESEHTPFDDVDKNCEIKIEFEKDAVLAELKNEMNIEDYDIKSVQNMGLPTTEPVLKQKYDDFVYVNETGQLLNPPRATDFQHKRHQLNRKTPSKGTLYKQNSENSSKIKRRFYPARYSQNPSVLIVHKSASEDYSLKAKHKASLKTHTLIDKNPSMIKMYKCESEGCSYRSNYKGSLKIHMLKHRKLKMYKCENEGCSYTSNYRGNLKVHLLKHNGPSEIKLHKCESEGCSFRTNRKGYLKVHMLRHKNPSEIKVYNCESEGCSYRSNFKENLRVHVLLHHKNLSDVTVYKCESEGCSYKTKRKHYLKMHMLVHKNPSETEMYKCEHEGCSFETKRKRDLKRHMLRHKNTSEIKMYKCESEGCSHRTKVKGYLKHHMLTHKNPSELKMYKCGHEGCSFETKRKYGLRRHMVVHKNPSEIMMHKCGNEGCLFESKRKETLKYHILLHRDPSAVKIYKCESGVN